MPEATTRNHAAFIWSVADLLRGDFKQNDYGDVILPLVVLRRLDCVLEPTREAVLEAHAKYADTIDNIAPVLEGAAGHGFYNTARIGFEKLLDDPTNLADNLRAYIAGFSTNARQIIEKFKFDTQITELDKAKLLFQVIGRFCEIDLHPDKVDNMEMGYLYEELIRHFSELSNETAGEHFTPREVIKLMVNLLLVEDDELLAKPGIIKTMLDPACGTGGMLSVAQDHLRDLNADARLEVFGQELNPETWAVCCSDLLLKGQDSSNVVLGNSFSEDGHTGGTFDYLLANPPFGVEWKKTKDEIKTEHRTQGFDGRFGAGTPRINDGSLLFLQHMISKMKPASQGGSRLAIVFNGSPLFTGAAGSGESKIRRWIIENDWLEAVVALPDQLFYNTGINIYFWIVTNRKAPRRRGKVQLIDARESWTSMRRNLGDKSKELTDDQIADVVRLYDGFEENDRSKIFTNQSFGHMRITVERPLHLRWEVNDETIAALKADKTFQKLFESGHYDEMDPDEGWEFAGEVFDRTFAALNGRRFESEATLSQALGAAAAAAWEDVDYPYEDTAFLEGKNPFGDAMDLTPATAKKLLKPFAIQDPDAPKITKRNGDPEPDTDLRGYETVPLPNQTVTFDEDPTERLEDGTHQQAVSEYMDAEVLPYAADAWVDHTKTKLGYEIPLTRHFYTYRPPRPLAEIDAEIKALDDEIRTLMEGVAE